MQTTSNEFQKNPENSKPSAAAPVLADYLDYRKYLQDFYAFKRMQTKKDFVPLQLSNVFVSSEYQVSELFKNDH